ncbi:hypothetical protein ACFWAT_07200 [Streptomyces syringium]|uniref:hypothetical protein n=1 Tax=Streptomyces syringium TaxID=76729 RepID=UPI00365EBF43
MFVDPDEIISVELDCHGWYQPHSREITRRQLGELLLKLDDMADDTAAHQDLR